MKFFYLPIFVLLIFFQNLSAQISNVDIDLIQSEFSRGKMEIVQEYIKLEKGEFDVFWSLYGEYEAKRKEIGRDRLDLVLHYNNNQLVLKGKDLDDEIYRFIDLKEGENDLLKKYYKKIRRDFGSKVASDFYIIEIYFQSIVSSNFMEQIPKLKEIDKNYKSK
jgi:hypothetical protein